MRNHEFDFIHKDGSLLPVLLNAEAVLDSKRRYSLSRSTVFDISEVKAIKAKQQ